VQHYTVADSYVTADDSRIAVAHVRFFIVGHMDHGKILDVCTITYDDAVYITPYHAAKPYRALFAHSNIPDHIRAFGYPAVFTDIRIPLFKLVKHLLPPEY
jgi:hypothetical protein